MRTHTIYIGVVDSKIGYWDQNRQPAKQKRARRKERIAWESMSGEEDFTVDFGAAWPFGGAPTVLSSTNGSIPPHTVDDQARLAPPYKYTVSILPSGPSEDPEIIIDPASD